MNIADIKKELSGDEKILESAFKLETFYKKHKFKIWAIVVAVILFFAGKVVMDVVKQSKLEASNRAFLTLQTKADDTEALAILKEKNPSLFELFTYAQSVKKQDIKALSSLTSSSNPVISDASKYVVATLEEKPVNSKLYAEMVILEEAYLNIKAGNLQEARLKLDLVDNRSVLSMLAQVLKHSTIIKAK